MRLGVMVVAGPEGFQKSAYRRFNIKDAGKFATQTGDDFAMMRQVMHRRFSRAVKEDPDRISGNWPDLLLIDGGLGQLSSVHDVLDELAVSDLQVVAISKGPDRHAGREQFHIRGRPSFTLPPTAPPCIFCSVSAMKRIAMRLALIVTNAQRPNLPTRLMPCRALAQNAKKLYWRILARRGLLLRLV